MTPKTHKIFTPGGTVTTRTARRFIVIAFRAEEFFVVKDAFHAERCRTKDRAEADRVAEKVGGRVVVFGRFAEVVKRTDAYATARREAAKVAGGMIFDAERGAGI